MSSPLTSVLGGTPNEAPGQQAPETPPAATGQPPLDLGQFIAEQGLDAQQAAELIQRARHLDSPEGQEALRRQFQEQYAPDFDQQRTQILTEELRKLSSDPYGRQTLQNLLAVGYREAGQQVPWESQQDDAYPDGESARYLRELKREIQELRNGMQQLGQMSQAQVAQQANQRFESNLQMEYGSWLRANPQAAAVQQELASDLWQLVRANPRAFQSQGAVARAASHLLSRYRGIANRFGQKPLAPKPGPRPGGGGSSVMPGMPEPASDDDAVAQVLAAMDHIQGGGG